VIGLKDKCISNCDEIIRKKVLLNIKLIHKNIVIFLLLKMLITKNIYKN